MKIYLLEAVHWHIPGRVLQPYMALTGPGGAEEEALSIVNALRVYLKMEPAEDSSLWENHLLEARQKRALELLGDDDVDNLAPEDDAYVVITELEVREPKPGPFHYTLKYRPASFATLPPSLTWEYVEAPSMSGIICRPDLPVSSHRYGVIKTDRALSDEECTAFEIIRL